jgi:hypothetical protein
MMRDYMDTEKLDTEKSTPLVPWTDKLSRQRSEHPDHIPVEKKTPHPVARRVSRLLQRSDRPR